MKIKSIGKLFPIVFSLIYFYGTVQPLLSMLSIKGVGHIRLGDIVSNFPSLKKINNKDTLRRLQSQFQIYKIDYATQNTDSLALDRFKIKRVAVSVNNYNGISAVHLLCDYNPEFINYIDENYGKHKLLGGLIYKGSNTNQPSMYIWQEGKIIGLVLRNMLFYDQTSNKQDQIIITFNNGNKKDYLLFY